jgi:FAD/FMN-containing dehydrogenase
VVAQIEGVPGTVQGVTGTVLRRGEQGYEDVRRAAVWQHRQPDRYPDMIVRVKNDQDVMAAVRSAREHGLKVKAVGGGHSYTNSAIRDGLLIDFTDCREVTIDAEARTAAVTPNVRGNDLNGMLFEHGLFFPSGHCPEVGLGGFLLQGGFGWNSMTLGMACSSVEAIDVVTADGELIHADDTTNSDYVWAARGSGAGFFGVVTRFYLRLHPIPNSMLMSLYAYPMDTYDDVAAWALETVKTLPRFVEPFLFGITPPGGTDQLLYVFAASYTDDDQEGRDALAAFERCPAIDRALERRFAAPTTFPELYDFMAMGALPGRYAVDGMWTDEPPATIAPVIRELIENVPSPLSTIFVMPWAHVDVPNGAFSVQSPLYISAGVIWDDERDDDRCIAWPGDQMRRFEKHSVGIQLAEENLINRPARFLSDENLARLERLRAKYDPTGIFHSYLREGEPQ